MTTTLAAPNFTDSQQDLIHSTAVRIVVASASGQVTDVARELGEIADTIVEGVFVTLKRNGRLRGCCGTVSQPTPLAVALKQAAERTAIDDQRFPPVSPVELPFLTLEVTLLSGFENVEATGKSRLAEIKLGQHGIRVSQGDSSGLLLPDVGPDNDWDIETLLQQACRKANLPINAWSKHETTLTRFEGTVIDRPIPKATAQQAADSFRMPISKEGVKALARFAHNNLLALMQGAVPGCFPANAPDANVGGLSLKVTLPKNVATATFSQLVLRGGLPLQTTLLNLCNTAAQWLKSIGMKPGMGPSVTSDLAVLHGASLHGSVEEFDSAGIDPRQRCLMITESGRMAWLFDENATVDELLEKTAVEAQVNTPGRANVLSVGISSSATTFSDANVPQPVRGPKERPAQSAGRFYPSSENALAAIVKKCLGEVPTQKTECSGILVPHAGLQYSGTVAGDVWKKVKLPSTVIIISPKHTRHGIEWAVAPHETWQLPQGSLPSDPELAKRLAERIDGLQLDAAAHADEHGIEVQLPLLHALAPETKVVGITIGGGDLKRCTQFGQQLALVLSELEEQPLLVISSDMHHFATDEDNRILDEQAMTALESLDPATVFDTVTRNSITMCGLRPAVIIMEALLSLDQLDQAERISYATSGDTSGDLQKVVGYASMIFREED